MSEDTKQRRRASHLGQTPWNKGMTKEEMLAAGRRVGSWPKGVPRPPETNEKISLANTGKQAWNKGRTREEVALEGKKLGGGRPKGGEPWNKGKKGIYKPATLELIGAASRGKKLSEKHRLALLKANTGRPCSKETRSKIGKKNQEAMRRNWKDPEYVLRILRSNQKKPNKVEIILEEILKQSFPQFKYNGDGRLGVVLAGLVPDFVNVDGHKDVIELFGEYWHRRKQTKWHQSESGRIAAYEALGVRCLVIWEKEIKNKAEVLEKVSKFVEQVKGE